MKLGFAPLAIFFSFCAFAGTHNQSNQNERSLAPPQKQEVQINGESLEKGRDQWGSCYISDARFTPNGESVQLVYDNGVMASFDAKTGQLQKVHDKGWKEVGPNRLPNGKLNLEQMGSPKMGLSHDGKYYAVGGRELEWLRIGEKGVQSPGEIAGDAIQVFDMENDGKPAFEIDVKGMGAVDSIFFSPDNKFVVTEHDRRQPALVFWKIENGKAERAHEIADIENASSFGPDFAGFSRDGTQVRFWAIPAGAHNPNDSNSGDLLTYDLKTGKVVKKNAQSEQPFSVAPGQRMHLNGSTRVFGRSVEEDQEGKVEIIDESTTLPLFEAQVEGRAVGSRLSEDGRLAVVDTNKGKSVLFEVASRKPIAEFASKSHFRRHTNISPDGKSVLIPQGECRFTVKNVESLVSLPKMEDESVNGILKALDQEKDPLTALAALSQLDKDPELAERVFDAYRSQSTLPSKEKIREVILGMGDKNYHIREASEKKLKQYLQQPGVIDLVDERLSALQGEGTNTLEAQYRLKRVKKHATKQGSLERQGLAGYRLETVAANEEHAAHAEFMNWLTR